MCILLWVIHSLCLFELLFLVFDLCAYVRMLECAESESAGIYVFLNGIIYLLMAEIAVYLVKINMNIIWKENGKNRNNCKRPRIHGIIIKNRKKEEHQRKCMGIASW